MCYSVNKVFPVHTDVEGVSGRKINVCVCLHVSSLNENQQMKTPKNKSQASFRLQFWKKEKNKSEETCTMRAEK